MHKDRRASILYLGAMSAYELAKKGLTSLHASVIMGPVDHSEQTGVFLNRGSYQSGQMGLTVNQLRELRRFESSTAHLYDTLYVCIMYSKVGPCGAAVAHSLGKTGVMGSIPITGSRGF